MGPRHAIALAATLMLAAGPAAAQQGGPLAASRAETTLQVEDPTTLMRLGASALEAGRLGEANEMLERAEARLLTRGELASEADRPAVGGAIGELAAAREAIGRRDRAAAATLVRSALDRLEQGEAPSITALPGVDARTGSSGLPGPAIGGGAPMAAPGTLFGGTASPAVPIGPEQDYVKPPAGHGGAPPTAGKPPLR